MRSPTGYRLFKDAGARDANEYEEMRLAGRDLEPVPILLVLIDEYLELFHNHPEWIDLVIHIGQEAVAATSSSPWAVSAWTSPR